MFIYLLDVFRREKESERGEEEGEGEGERGIFFLEIYAVWVELIMNVKKRLSSGTLTLDLLLFFRHDRCRHVRIQICSLLLLLIVILIVIIKLV